MLSPQEVRVLTRLLEAQGQPVSRALLLEALGKHKDTGSNLIEVHVSRLRAKLKSHKIAAERGVGWLILPNLEYSTSADGKSVMLLNPQPIPPGGDPWLQKK